MLEFGCKQAANSPAFTVISLRVACVLKKINKYIGNNA